MYKVLRNNNTVVVILDNGVVLQKANIDSSFMDKLKEAKNVDDIRRLFNPEMDNVIKESQKIKQLLQDVQKSKELIKRGDSIYWNGISELSMPQELIKAVLSAEEAKDEIKLETYKNFWTLMSLNPDERCRQNLFWFLNKNGLIISRCGFFVAYRNVEKTSEEGIFTDYHTHTFKIKIGEMVTMPREECDPVQENTCSKGLHLGSKSWLAKGYYGDVGLVCLCNPAEVVAVPPLDSYGKLRTSAYLPIDFIDYDSDGRVIPYNMETGFECEYVPKVIYEGLMGTEKDSNYKIIIPDIPNLNKDVISNRLLDIARECIVNRNIYVESKRETR